MAGYVSSNRNRFYAALEAAYGQPQAVTSVNRFPAMHLKASQIAELAKRLDKTGTRTYSGPVNTGRITANFEVLSYLAAWSGSGEPGYGPFFQAACGAAPLFFTGALVNSLISPTELVTSIPHGLVAGQAISWMNEIRFVTYIPNAYTFLFNAPFTNSPGAGVLLGPTVTYQLATNLPSVTVYDYWDANPPIDRFLRGCAVDTLELVINGDYHQFRFSGPAVDLTSAIATAGASTGSSNFPVEPTMGQFSDAGVPGHLGQAWIGTPAAQFLTLIDARIQLKNNLLLRTQEFGLLRPAAVVPGERQVTSAFSLLVEEDTQTMALYTAAQTRQPFPAMLQLGTQQGQLMGVYLPNVTAQIPTYNDSSVRLSWDFQSNVAQGTQDDELYIAFA